MTTLIYFKNRSQIALFAGEMMGQISDGKYENRRPLNHWAWVCNVSCRLGKEIGYRGPKHIINYNLREWPSYIIEGQDWANRVLDYGRAGKVAEILNLSAAEFAREMNGDFRYDVEQLGRFLRNNPDATYYEFAEFVKSYRDDASSKWSGYKGSEMLTDEFAQQFYNESYTIKELGIDLVWMARSVNTMKQ